MDRVPYAHADALRAELGGAKLILDVGGGTGRIARRLSPARVVIVDVERAMLLRARERGLDVVQADAARLPFRDETIQAVLMVDAFHHLPSQREALVEARRVLHKDGKLVLEEFDPTSIGGAMIEFGEKVLRFGSRFHAPDSLHRLVEQVGFRVRTDRRTRRDYAIIGQKGSKERVGIG